MKTRASLFVLLLLGACGLAGPRHATTTYLLEDQAAPTRIATAWPGALLLRPTDAPSFYQSNAMAFSQAPGRRGHYQYALMTEDPAERLNQLLLQRLRGSGLFPVVVTLGSGVTGDYQLNSRLLDFYHDAAQVPGKMNLVLDVELVRRGDAHLLAETRIATQAPASSSDARGAAAASNVAVTQALDQITAWLASLPRP